MAGAFDLRLLSRSAYAELVKMLRQVRDGDEHARAVLMERSRAALESEACLRWSHPQLRATLRIELDRLETTLTRDPEDGQEDVFGRPRAERDRQALGSVSAQLLAMPEFQEHAFVLKNVAPSLLSIAKTGSGLLRHLAAADIWWVDVLNQRYQATGTDGLFLHDIAVFLDEDLERMQAALRAFETPADASRATQRSLVKLRRLVERALGDPDVTLCVTQDPEL